jgi:predicted sulfurtransferase
MIRRTFLQQCGRVAAVGLAALPWPARAQYAVPTSADAVPRMSMADFKALVDKGGVTVVDVRSLADYRLGHIPNAIAMPLNEVASRVAELRGLGKPIVTYCT